MLSNPAVLGEVGMVLGTFCHLFIVVGCAFACYLLLTARELAKGEILAKEDLRLKGSMAALQAVDWMGSAGRQQQQQQQQQQHIQLQPNQQKQSLEQNLQQTAPQLPLAAPEVPSTVGWGRFQESLHQAVESQTPNSNCNDTSCSESEEQPTSPWSISKTPPRTVQEALSSSTNTSRTSHRTTPNRKMSTTNNSSSNTSTNPLTTSKSSDVSDEYQRFPDDIENHPLRNTGVSNTTLSSAPKRPPVRLVTYGDVAKYLAGPTLSSFVVFTIVTVHLMFASGMVHLAVENLCYVAGWDKLGYSYNEVYVEEDNAGDGGGGGGDGGRRLGPSEDNNYDNDQAVEEEAYAEWEGPDFTGRLAMASLLFPIIHGLLQIPSLRELATISSIGLLTYVVGCIGSMMYTAIVLTGGHPFLDEPEDMWQTKWSGIPTYVATTIYAIEGINLALPTVSSLEGSERVRWGGSLIRKSSSGPEGKKNDRSDKSVFIVVGAVFLYGLVTLVVSWVGLAGGLGGGIGTMHGEDGCRDVTYCFDSSGVRFVYMLSLGVALILTLPVILYPSTEMLEIWLDEREDERRRKMLNVSTIPPQLDSLKTNQRQSIRQQIRHKSLIEDDDETLCTISNPVSPHENEHSDLYKEIEMKDLRERNGGYSAPGRAEEFTPKKSNTANNLCTSKSSTSFGREPLVHEAEATSTRPRRRQKYWKLRMFLAFIICVIGTLEGSFPVVVKAAEVIRGVGLSIAGLIFPPLLYMSAVGGRFSAAMASAMALLIGLGLFNIVLVLMSAFGETDYILEEGPGHFYNID